MGDGFLRILLVVTPIERRWLEMADLSNIGQIHRTIRERMREPGIEDSCGGGTETRRARALTRACPRQSRALTISGTRRRLILGFTVWARAVRLISVSTQF
jgi:hypothetical protein